MKRVFDPKGSWDSDSDDILHDFYKPALQNCKQYDRLAGYFSSTSFIVAVKEMLDFIEHGGMMRLITSAQLSQQDIVELEKKSSNVKQELSKNILDELEKANTLGKKCTAIMGWMLSNYINGVPQLEIKIAVPKDKGIFHAKVGIMKLNNNDVISFSGSINETGNAWKHNIEEFKVFKNWLEEQRSSINHDIHIFQKFYENNASSFSVYDIPEAVKNHMLKNSPKSTKEFENLVKEIRDELYEQKPKIEFELRDYQKDAVNTWVENNFCGIFEMATGTGKTYTALSCIKNLCYETKRLAVVIITPQKLIIEQWISSIENWNRKMPDSQKITNNVIKAYADHANWKNDLSIAIKDFNNIGFSGNFLTNHCIICTTYDTFSSDHFIEKIKMIKGNILLIADEVHHSGSPVTSLGLLTEYKYRLGLSATPIRHYDDMGSDMILEYFGKIIYKMSIKRAIDEGYLVPYEYRPIYSELNDEEMERYKELTKKIAKKLHINKNNVKTNDDVELANTHLETARANLISTSEQKYEHLKRLLRNMNNHLERTLIYCHEKQLARVTSILSSKNINNTSITWKNTTQDRGRILNLLKDRNYQCVTAIKCLDEGVDVPSASMGIIMASTGNPLQYIQRRGRLLRPNNETEKTLVIIYDILVRPPAKMDDDEIATSYVKKLVARELLRHKEFADIAKNRDEAFIEIRNTAKKFSIDVDRLSDEYIKNL